MSESLAWAMVPARAAMKRAGLIWFREKNSRPYCKMASPNKVMIGPTTTNSTMALPRWRGATDAGGLGRFMAGWAQGGYGWIKEAGFSVKQNLVTCPGRGLVDRPAVPRILMSLPDELAEEMRGVGMPILLCVSTEV